MLRGHARLERPTGALRRLILAAGAVLLAVTSLFAYADALDGVLEVRSAYVNIDNGVFLLHARIEYPVNPKIRDALRDGVTLTFDLETRVDRERRFWFNANIVELTLRRELAYHAVSDRYVVRDVKSDEQQTFPTLEEALAYLGKVDGWPILVEPQLNGGSYVISVRAGVRRGRLPASLRALLFWADDSASRERVVLMVTPGVNEETKTRIRPGSVALLVLWLAIGAGALLLLLKSVQNSTEFGRLQPAVLLLNVIGVIALVTLLARKLWQLFREYRDHVPGSRLIARTVMIFGALVVAPLLIVYLSSLEFLDRGIDSWFQVEVKRGLNDAVDLSRAALNLRMREYSERTQSLAHTLGKVAPAELQTRLDDERRVSEALEIVLFGGHERIIASSLENPLETLPSRPPSDLLRQVGQMRPYVSLEPQAGGKYIIRTAAAVADTLGGADTHYVVAIYPVPAQLSELAEAVQRSYSQYGDVAAMREPLKYSFRLTLTLVLLLAMLAAMYGAIFSAQRLVAPVQDLIAGTRAVGKGDFGTRLPLPSRDEMGFLVHSFNDMTKRLRRAREEATHSQQAVERERERLAIILARLSTGVLAVDRVLTVRMANQAADAILGSDLSAATGRALPELAATNERLGQFVAAIAVRFAGGREEWREQLDLDSQAGRRVLMCACTPLPVEDSDMGYVIVFDDITALLQAQRDAAWGEVARRLAHEIKNPLTPIQLSAERLRRRLLSTMKPPDAEILDRATHTIVQQVETMQQMVNAFSEYARAPEMRVTRFSLNQLIVDVTDLYRSQDPRAAIQLALDETLDMIEADRGRVRQILNNLVTNALEALDGVAQPVLEISTRPESGGEAAYAVITVCDNGPGFQRELLGRVFDPYVTSKPKGTGLGLAIVKKIVEEHGGRIDADNRSEGGARVRVVLPVKDSTRSATGGARVRELKGLAHPGSQGTFGDRSRAVAEGEST